MRLAQANIIRMSIDGLRTVLDQSVHSIQTKRRDLSAEFNCHLHQPTTVNTVSSTTSDGRVET